MADQSDRDAVLNEVLQIINHARMEAETDLRQIRNWIEALKTQSATDLLKELES